MNNSEKLTKVGINWYPGHMAKTRKQIEEDLKIIDVVIELLDARIPKASRNPDIHKLTQNKKRIILLNKCDLADENMNKKWQEKLSKEAPTIITDSNTGKGMDKVTKQIDCLMKEEIERQKARGRVNKTIRVMILGIPNVGKSSFINKMSKKNSMEVGNKPGITKNKQWIKIGKNQELLDTPGVLWPKFDNEEIALNLAYTGSIKDDILERTEIAYRLLKFLYDNYKSSLKERYKISDDEILEAEKCTNITYELLNIIARKTGSIVSGGNIDDEKVARLILDDFRNCKFGKITLEKP